MKRILTLLLMVSLLSIGSAYASEQDAKAPCHKCGKEKIKRDFENRLNLTDKQKKKQKPSTKKATNK